jgi:hypothetical protein
MTHIFNSFSIKFQDANISYKIGYSLICLHIVVQKISNSKKKCIYDKKTAEVCSVHLTRTSGRRNYK